MNTVVRIGLVALAVLVASCGRSWGQAKEDAPAGEASSVPLRAYLHNRSEEKATAAEQAAARDPDEERAKYEGYVRASKFIAILQAKARKLIAS